MNGLRALLAAVMLALVTLWPTGLAAQSQPGGPNDIAVELVADGAPKAGSEWTVALHFTPRTPEWHGYWSNPGDAGLGMEMAWSLPDGWVAGAPLYPLPKRLVIGELMNHVYEGPHVVLVPIAVPAGASLPDAPIRLTVRYLACTDTICVPQVAELTLDAAHASSDPRFDGWRSRIVPPLGSAAMFEFSGDRLRIGIPLPAASGLGDPHVFLGTGDIGGLQRPIYSARQTFRRQGDLLVAEIPLAAIPVPPNVRMTPLPRPQQVTGILDFGTGHGAIFAAVPGDVPLEGVRPMSGGATPALWQLLLAALAGGLLLNVMPCVFPILSLKALALARAGGSEHAARADALAYAAGVVLASAALGGAVLLLRAAGEQVGWAFQLQNPVVVVGLFLLALAITANFLGAFEVPGMAISGGKPSRGGSFATGLLAAFVATPCTGPFMALALGAALVLPPLDAVLVFVALGVGLALPFLLVGFVPAIRARLPKPGAWMERFRRWMALPMGLTALALAWLVWRIGGVNFLFIAALMGAVVVLWLVFAGRLQRRGKGSPVLAALAGVVALGLVLLPPPEAPAQVSESLLDPLPFSETALADARATGKPVFLWFTADWCVTCKVNEGIAIETEETRAAFARAGVIAMRADWTRPNEEISRILTRQGAAGVPLYIWYAPGGEAEQLPQVLTPDLLAQKARASR